RPGHAETRCLTVLSVGDSRAEATQGQLRRNCGGARQGHLRWTGKMFDLPCATALYRARTQPARSKRNRCRFFSGRPFADAWVSHCSPEGAMDTHQRWLFPRWTLCYAERRGRTLQQFLQSGSERPAGSRPSGIPQVVVTVKKGHAMDQTATTTTPIDKVE